MCSHSNVSLGKAARAPDAAWSFDPSSDRLRASWPRRPLSRSSGTHRFAAYQDEGLCKADEGRHSRYPRIWRTRAPRRLARRQRNSRRRGYRAKPRDAHLCSSFGDRAVPPLPESATSTRELDAFQGKSTKSSTREPHVSADSPERFRADTEARQIPPLGLHAVLTTG
jgi:hypothetical protein